MCCCHTHHPYSPATPIISLSLCHAYHLCSLPHPSSPYLSVMPTICAPLPRPPSTVPQDLLNKQSHLLLHIRHQFKIAFFTEMRQDPHTALRYYHASLHPHPPQPPLLSLPPPPPSLLLPPSRPSLHFVPSPPGSTEQPITLCWR